ncbi:enoyl-CoA hydratase/isomerase family protein [Xanthobacter autotrophicus]|uniref:enoyl-CoA hydratase-related protein n=1 Tax=Xanthobacter TaxID=279 RepID=UPI0024AC634C|nr:enoyl-CoA hydratase-related protein [Xanthobacter autotrophicus]MDI4663933.1 enoyl-CoA hydratase/isomerase family protein [Xanthobacter autotrophicus]
MSFELIRTNIIDRVGWITLDRRDALNALNAVMVGEIASALAVFSANPDIGCVVITGSDRAFAAGADIKEAVDRCYPETFLEDFLASWDAIASLRKPLVAAVAGYALGGGCEVVLMCDVVIAADTARFGLPEVKIGVMPGAGGTQRLVRAVGKAKAMDLCLTGRMMDASEAELSGLVSRVVPASNLRAEAQAVAEAISTKSRINTMAIKESVNRAFETSLSEGLLFERRTFQSLFATHDQKEGMAAFVEKRAPQFRGR